MPCRAPPSAAPRRRRRWQIHRCFGQPGGRPPAGLVKRQKVTLAGKYSRMSSRSLPSSALLGGPNPLMSSRTKTRGCRRETRKALHFHKTGTSFMPPPAPLPQQKILGNARETKTVHQPSNSEGASLRHYCQCLQTTKTPPGRLPTGVGACTHHHDPQHPETWYTQPTCSI